MTRNEWKNRVGVIERRDHMLVAFSRTAALLFFSLIPALAAASGPIMIQADGDFLSCGCVSSGSGTPSDPYIIGPLSIRSASGNAVYVDGSALTKSFVLYNLTITNATNTGITLNHINPSGNPGIVAAVFGPQTSVLGNSTGILVENSSYVTLDGGGENPRGPGVQNSSAGTINKNGSGAIDVENSSHITIKGWQLSTNGPSIQPDWVTLDPSVNLWSVGGIRFFGVSYSTIDHNSANNCTDASYSLFNSNHNIVSNNTADYPFTMNYLIADGSSYNTFSGNEGSTGDFIGLLLADPLPGSWTLAQYGPSHDNLIVGNTIHSDGPTGNELNPVSVCPAFVGQIVVLNGTYNNHITNNATWGSFGLVWAQAVPSNSTPIGVVTYPPTLHCNVTASEGGGGIANLNGNVWTGNTFKSIDSCLPAQ